MFRLIAILGAGLLGGVTYLMLSASVSGGIPYTDQGRIAEGAVIYQAHCASCHGADLEGEPHWQYPDHEGYMPAPPHDGTGHTHEHSDVILFNTVKLGPEATVCTNRNSRMGGYADVLTDAEIYYVLAYIKSTWPDEIISRHERVNGRPG